MRFYFNMDENLCADEESVIDFLFEEENDYPDDREEIREELHTCREYYGWYECEVSDAIKEKFNT